MRRYWIAVTLVACMCISLYLRVVLPYDYVFTGDTIKFSGVDAYWQMAGVDRIAPVFPSYLGKILDIPLFVWLISGVAWLAGLGNPSQHIIDTVGAFFPAVLAAITVIPVYFIGKAMFGRIAGVMAALLIAILPGEWLGRSVVGFTDHHVAEVLFSSCALLFFYKAITADKGPHLFYTTLCSLFIGMSLQTSVGTIVFLGIIGLYLVWQVISNAIRRDNEPYTINLLAIGIVGSLIFWLAKPELVQKMITSYGIFTTSMARTTAEMYPLLFPLGTFSIAAAWEYYGLIIFLIPVAILAIIYHAIRQGKASYILLAVWSLTTLAMTLEYRRFGYLFAVNAALISGWAIWYLWQRYSKPVIWYAVMAVVILSSVLVIPNFQNASDGDYNAPFVPSDAWCDTLAWVKDNTPEDSVILAWWDYGYWINRMADRDVYVNPSQDPIPVQNVASFFLTGEPNIEADYLILDYTTSISKLNAIAISANRSITDYAEYYLLVEDEVTTPIHIYYPKYYESLMVRLYNFNGNQVTPFQSSVIRYDGRTLIEIATFPSYEKAMQDSVVDGRLVGTSPYISPVPLNEMINYQLVYESPQKTGQAIAEIKVFKINGSATP